MTFQVTIIFGLGSMSFCGGHYEFGWVTFIMTDWLAFRVQIFWQPFWSVILDFGLQAANYRSPHWAFAVLNRYIFVCQMESYSGCTVHTLTCLSVDLMFYHNPRRSPNIKTTLIQRLVFKKNCNCYFICSIWKVSMSLPNTQYWFNTGPPSATLARNWNIG